MLICTGPGHRKPVEHKAKQAHACAQAYAALYQWHERYPLSNGPFGKVGARAVLDTLRDFAVKEGVDRHIDFDTEVVTVRELPSGRCSS